MCFLEMWMYIPDESTNVKTGCLWAAAISGMYGGRGANLHNKPCKTRLKNLPTMFM